MFDIHPDRERDRILTEQAMQAGKPASVADMIHAQYAGRTATIVLSITAIARAILTVVYGLSLAAIVWLFLLERLEPSAAAIAFVLFALLSHVANPEPKRSKDADPEGTDRKP